MLLALSLVQVLWVQPLGSLPVSLLVTVVAVVPLAWRRARPVLAATVGTAAWLVPTDAFLFVGFVVAILLFFALGRWTADWRLVALVCAWGLAVGTLGTLRGPEEPVAGLLSTWLAVLAPAVVGRRHARAGAGGGAAAGVRARGHPAPRGRGGALPDRERAARRARPRGHPDLDPVRGRERRPSSWHPSRRPDRWPPYGRPRSAPAASCAPILGLLGHGELPVATDARGLAELTDRATRLGIPTSLTVTGTPWPDAPQHWLAVNRIVQECLTNAGKHAPGEQVAVGVDWAEDGVGVRVTNPAPAVGTAGSGLGLPGMAERARLLGGTLDSGSDGGCFTVTAWLPATVEQQP